MSPRQHRSSHEHTRRQALAKGGATLATSLSVLTAGCLSSLPPLGGNQRYGRLGAPSGGDPSYRQWLPAPTTIDPPVEQYAFTAMRPTGARPDAPEAFIARRAHSKADTDYFGIGFENYEWLVDSTVGTVIKTTFDRTHVVQTLTNSGYERAGDYRGYSVYARSDVPRRVAVGDGILVWTNAYIHDRPNLEALVDAGAGDRLRYHEQNSRFDRLTTAAGGNGQLLVNTDIRDPTGRPAMIADAFRFDDDAAYQVVYYHYGNDRVPTKSALQKALQKDDYRYTSEAETFDVQIDDQLATVETRVPLTAEREISPQYDLPQVTWGGQYDQAETSVTVRHEAGESVPAARLYYDVDSPDDFGEIETQPLWSDRDTVSSGMEATIDLRDHPNAKSVSLVYSTGGTHFHVLFELELHGGADD